MLQMEDEKPKLVQTLALPAIFGKAFQPVTPSYHKARNIWVAMTQYFLGQGIIYRTVANKFSAAVPTVCLIIYEKTKANNKNNK